MLCVPKNKFSNVLVIGNGIDKKKVEYNALNISVK